MNLEHNELFIDMETYSELDLNKVSSVVYSKHHSTKILFMTYKLGSMPTKVWYPNTPWDIDMSRIKKVYAHNMGFDYRMWIRPGKKQGLPALDLKQCTDTMAIANRYTYPSGLKDIGNVLDLETKKDTEGINFINIFSKPGLEHKRTPALFQKFVDYGITDTNSSVEMLDRFPTKNLTPIEEKLWRLTFYQNERGLPIDLEAVNAVMKVVNEYQSSMSEVLTELTDGVITKATQVQRIKKWCNMHGFPIENTTAPVIKESIKKIEEELKNYNAFSALNSKENLETIKMILEIRRDCGKSSVAKYTKMREMYHEGRVFDILQYYGAFNTGRWAGRGVQPHNFTREKVEDPEKWIKMFLDFEPMDNPVIMASKLCRSMICAKQGYKFLVSDYSSIENRILAWIADDQVTLQSFRMNEDQYVDMASFLYNVDREKLQAGVDSEETWAQDMRQMGKVIILGCGYMMGAKRFRAVAKDWGMEITGLQATQAVKAYRKKYHKVAKMWYTIANAGKKAILNPGTTFKAHKCRFVVVEDRGTKWLRVVLPSGRALMYNNPSLGDGLYGTEIKCYRWVAHGWRRATITPGLFTENIVQAIARDVMGNGLLNIEKYMPQAPTLFSVHDEAVSEVKDMDATMDDLFKYNELLCKPKAWMRGLPLEADGYISQRYKKA